MDQLINKEQLLNLLQLLRAEGVLSYKYNGLELVLGNKPQDDTKPALAKEDNLADRLANERQDLKDFYAALPSFTPLRDDPDNG